MTSTSASKQASLDRNIADVLMLAFMAQPDRKEG